MKDYLAEYDAAPEDQQYPLAKHWMETEPLPFFKQLREQRPLLATPECVLVARHHDITHMLSMPKVFTMALYRDKMGVTPSDEGYLMAHDDDALHYREKSIMQGFLNRDDLPAVRNMVSGFCQEALQNAGGRFDAIPGFTRYVPARLVQEYFGFDDINIADILRWSYWNQYDAFHNQPFDLNSEEIKAKIKENKARVSDEFTKAIGMLIAKKTIGINLQAAKRTFLLPLYWFRLMRSYLKTGKAPVVKDDIATRILKSAFDDEVSFDIVRKGTNIGGLLIGTIETTSKAVARTIEYFLNNPQRLAQFKTLANSGDVYAADAMVWEALRFVPNLPYVFRQAGMDVILGENTPYATEVKRGTSILLLTQSAMFDEAVNKQPGEFNPDRNWYNHFNFGFGSHECLGKYIGMVMIPEMVKQVLSLPEVSAEAPVDYKNGPFPEAYPLMWR